MSVLAHRCRTCRHLAGHHGERERGYTGCACCRAGRADPDPAPELFATWAFPGGAAEDLWAPGTTRNAGTMHAVTTCGCEACRAAATALTRPLTPMLTQQDAGQDTQTANGWSAAAAG